MLALIVLAVFGSLGLARFGYTSILPAMQEGIHLTNRQTGELQSWNLLGYMLTVVAAGVLATRFGPRVVITIALLVTGTGLVLTGLVPTFHGARIGRFLAGVGGFLWGSLSDRWGRRAALVGVFAVQGLPFLMIGSSRELPLVLGSAALFALTAWSIPALMAALCSDLFGARLAICDPLPGPNWGTAGLPPAEFVKDVEP